MTAVRPDRPAPARGAPGSRSPRPTPVGRAAGAAGGPTFRRRASAVAAYAARPRRVRRGRVSRRRSGPRPIRRTRDPPLRAVSHPRLGYGTGHNDRCGSAQGFRCSRGVPSRWKRTCARSRSSSAPGCPVVCRIRPSRRSVSAWPAGSGSCRHFGGLRHGGHDQVRAVESGVGQARRDRRVQQLPRDRPGEHLGDVVRVHVLLPCPTGRTEPFTRSRHAREVFSRRPWTRSPSRCYRRPVCPTGSPSSSRRRGWRACRCA